MDKKRSSACNVTKSNPKSTQQPKISTFFNTPKSASKSLNLSKTNGINSSKTTLSPKKRKSTFDSDLMNNVTPTSKLRKTSTSGLKEQEQKNSLLSKLCQDEFFQDSFEDNLFFEIDFSTISPKKSNGQEKLSKNNCDSKNNTCKDSGKKAKNDCESQKENGLKSPVKTNGTCEKSRENGHLKKTKEKATIGNENDEFDLSDLFEDDWGEEKVEANFSDYRRCQVFDIEYHLQETLITVKEVDFGGEGVVRCRGFWKDVKLKKDQICTIKAIKEGNQWIVDNNNGLVVNDPDMLMAGTTIVGGLFCSRRSVLQDIFNGIQTLPHYVPDAITLVCGIISHEVMQEALQNNIDSIAGITAIYDRKLKSDHFLDVLYANNLTLAEINKHTQPYLNHIFNFIQMYVKGKNIPSNKLQCRINAIQDIEENIWMPKVGLKGKIDITAQVNIHSRRKIMPIEIKTGKPSFSVEHRGQVMLYILMMQLTGRDVDSGLLLYLKDNIMQEIKGSHQEIRDLVLLRNSLTHYLSNKLESVEAEQEKCAKYSLKLPEPISHPACERCPVNTLCSIYLSEEDSDSFSESQYLKKIGDEALSHLTPAHIEYVLKWSVLLQLEQAAETKTYSQSDVWTLDATIREKRGTCISYLKIVGKVVEENKKFIHIFTRQNNGEDVDFTFLDFSEEEYVIISTSNRVNIAAGKIRSIEANTIAVNVNRNILLTFPNETFYIDKYGSSSSLIGFNNAGNVGGLLDNHENCARLRRIIIDKSPATFLEKLPTAIEAFAIKRTKCLNSYQHDAIMKVLAANDYVLIKGMPGTGKTQTLVVLIELLAKLGKSIIVTAHTNSAVDNILLKLLKKNVDFLRLGSSAKIHPALKSKCEPAITAGCKTTEDLHAAFCSKNIIGVTCYSAHHPLLAKKMFDICIVDEATQVLQSTILRPLYSARKFVLVGDPDQLPPIAKSNEARKLGLNESLFQRLDSDNNTACLKAQYRMNNRIMDVANKLTYDDKLISGSDEIGYAILEVKNPSVIESSEQWVKKVLSLALEDSAILIDTGPTWILNTDDFVDTPVKTKDFLCNPWEVSIILRLIDTLLKAGVSHHNIGVMSPYRSQVSYLKKNLHNDVEINTVDQYQGRDKEVIIYSCTKSMKDSCSIKEFDLLQDHSRLTVAVTRAKHKLIVIGDKTCLDRYTPFNKLFKSVRDEHVIVVKDGENDFHWRNLLKEVNI